jgi:hypothetical protein
MDNNNDKEMEDDLRKLAAKACRKIMRSLEQEPSVILESDEVGDVPNSIIEEIEVWLFKRRQNNGDKNN